jgi:N-acetylneuraminic acid mutarotase
VTAPMVKQRAYAGSVQLKDGRVLVAGGIAADGSPVWHMMANAEIYDPASNTWSATASLSGARSSFVLTLLSNGQVLAIGGTRTYEWTESSLVGEIEVYDPHTSSWQIVSRLPQPSAFAAVAFFHDGRVWVTGGYDGPSSESISNATWIVAPTHLQP